MHAIFFVVIVKQSSVSDIMYLTNADRFPENA
jgi:hypothetical protein